MNQNVFNGYKTQLQIILSDLISDAMTDVNLAVEDANSKLVDVDGVNDILGVPSASNWTVIIPQKSLWTYHNTSHHFTQNYLK